MALRDPAAKLTTFTYAGVLCLAGAGRTCIAHGLPETPDTFHFTPLAGSNHASLYPQAAHVESWDASVVVLINSINFGLRTMFEAKVVWSPQL